MICKFCFKESDAGSQYKQKKFCNLACQQKWWNRHNYGENFSKGIAPGTVGAIAELAVSIDLMKNGFEVYRALSPSSKCDILAIKNGKSYPIEIRSGYINTKNKIVYPKHRINAPYIIVYSHVKNSVHYITELT